MSFNGSGTYSLPGSQLANGDTVSATENNQFRNDVATAFNVTVCRDGQAAMTGNLPMGGNKLTNLAAGTSAGDSVRYQQVTSAVAITGGTISGTTMSNNTISSLAVDLAIADGGTGASTAANARTNLGLGTVATLNSITTAYITDLNVTTAKIADLNVTTGKLADTAVTTAKITDLNVTTGKLADNAVTTAKITDANVTPAKLSQPLTTVSVLGSTTSIAFTGIPSWATIINIAFVNSSVFAGSYPIKLQIGTGGTPTYITSGYSSPSISDGILIATPGAGVGLYGGGTLKKTGTVWSYFGVSNLTSGGAAIPASGGIATGGPDLTAIRFIASNTGAPSDSFASGYISITYQ